jgi:hypothetical protein
LTVEHYLLNYNFPSLSPAASTWLRRRLPLLLVILAVNLALALGPAHRGGPGVNRNQRLALADDTPELLRLSRAQGLLTVSPGGPGLGMTAAAIANLPPPPPANLPLVKAGSLPPFPADSQPQRPSATPAPVQLPPPRLPDRASVALEAIRQLVRPAAPTATNPDRALGRDELAAIQRRQWWLSGGQEPVLQQLWQAGVSVSPPSLQSPSPLADLPAGVELRQLPAGAWERLGLVDPHGHSLVGRSAAVLIWRQGNQFWALRLPLGEALTNS